MDRPGTATLLGVRMEAPNVWAVQWSDERIPGLVAAVGAALKGSTGVWPPYHCRLIAGPGAPWDHRDGTPPPDPAVDQVWTNVRHR